MKFGLDVGHCETTGTVPYPSAAAEDGGNKYKLMRLSMAGSETVIPTQIILSNDQMRGLSGNLKPSYALMSQLGEFRIGKGLPEAVEDGEKFCYFKVQPKDFDKPCGNSDCARENGITHGMVMACYVFALLESILANNTDITKGLSRESIDLLIGCPTTGDWTTAQAQEDYAALIREATGVHSVRIVPESRAAMFSSVDKEDGRVSTVQGAIVFDFGSSTADCTYMLLGRKLIEFSWTLGAFEIEHQMTLAALEETVQKRGRFEVDRLSFVEVEDQLRQTKEFYYSGKFPKGKKEYCTFHDAVDAVPLMINRETMDSITMKRPIQIRCDSQTTRTGSWQKLCREFFQESKSRVEAASYLAHGADGQLERNVCTIDTIVLTGGASNMGFIFDICRDVFPDIKIVKEEQASYTVSSGLAWVAVSDDEFEPCVSMARDALEKKSNCSVQALHTAISDGIFTGICDIAEDRTKKWADKPGDGLTLRDLHNDLTDYIGRPDTQEFLEKICQEKIDQWKDALSQEMEIAVNNQVKRLYSPSVVRALMIPNDVWKDLQAGALGYGDIDATGILKKLDLSGFLRKIGILIIQTAIWIAGAVFAFETFFVSVLLAWIASELAGDALKDKDLDKKRKRTTRQNVAGKIRSTLLENKSEIMKGFNESLAQQTADYSGMVEDTLKKAFEIVTLRRFDL